MIKLFFICALLLLISGILRASDGVEVILLKETGTGIETEKISLKNNTTQVFPGSEVVSVILPISPGRSGEFIQKADREDNLILSNKDGVIKFSAQSSDGKTKSFPDIKYDDLKSYEIRVNIIGSEFKKAYLIKNYTDISEDEGPVMDLFGGKMQPKAGEYIITYETTVSTMKENITGVPFIKNEHGWVLIEGELGDKKGYFIVDFAATGTVILKDFVPPGIQIAMPTATQYSVDGEKKVVVKMQGANDTVSSANFLGKTDPLTIKFGGMSVNDLSISVLNHFPPIMSGEYNIIGIVGMDIIRRAGSISIEGLNSDASMIQFGKGIKEGKGMPVHSAGSFVFVDGSIGGAPVSILIDTGARFTIISKSLLDKLSIPYSSTGIEKRTAWNGWCSG